MTYDRFELFPASDGCNFCECIDGIAQCTAAGCSCTVDSLVYSVGQSFRASDGCNICSCTKQDSIECTSDRPCETACKELAPGCGDRPLPKAGCYVVCSEADDCEPFEQCVTRHVDDDTNGCGVEVRVCLDQELVHLLP